MNARTTLQQLVGLLLVMVVAGCRATTPALPPGAVAVTPRTSSPPPTPPATATMETYGFSAPPVPLASTGDLAPQTYVLVNPYRDEDPVRDCARGCAWYERIIFTLPAGWATGDGRLSKHRGEPGEVAFSVWTPDQVYNDPCHWQGSALSPFDDHDSYPAPNASGVIDPEIRFRALANQVGRNASAITRVTLGRQGALKIELSVPAQLDLATCDRGEFRSWTEWDVVDGANAHHAPGQIDAVYIVDVDRRVLVIDASHMPATAEGDLAELEAILAAMIIERR